MRKILVLAVLCVVMASACTDRGGNNIQTTTADSVGTVVVSGQIAYINIDSLMNSYNMFLDLSSELETKAKKVESDLTARSRNFERSVADFQEKIEKGLVTRSQAAQMEEDLGRRQQTLMQQSNQAQMELQEENQVMMNRIYNAIETFIKEYNSDYRYSMIMTTSGGTPILHANPALDITAEVLTGLNEAYAKELKNN